jgi:Siphovirus Gp157
MTQNLSAAVAAHRELVDHIKALYPEENEETLADTIAGETQLDGAVLAVLREALWREAQSKAISGMIEKLRDRKTRLEVGADSLRAVALKAMQDAGRQSIKASDMSVSIGRGLPKIIITDETMIPSVFVRIKREPDRTAIRNDLQAGNNVPGATLGNAADVMRIRRD